VCFGPPLVVPRRILLGKYISLLPAWLGRKRPEGKAREVEIWDMRRCIG